MVRAQPAKLDSIPSALVVDDDVDVAEAIADFLAQVGIRAAVACDPTHVLPRLLAEPGITVMVTDLRMPRIDGIHLGAMVAEAAVATPVEAILITANGDPAAAFTAGRGPFFGFLAKPFDPHRLAEMVAMADSSARQRRSSLAPRPAPQLAGIEAGAVMAMTMRKVIGQTHYIDRHVAEEVCTSRRMSSDPIGVVAALDVLVSSALTIAAPCEVVRFTAEAAPGGDDAKMIAFRVRVRVPATPAQPGLAEVMAAIGHLASHPGIGIRALTFGITADGMFEADLVAI